MGEKVVTVFMGEEAGLRKPVEISRFQFNSWQFLNTLSLSENAASKNLYMYAV